jgi:hypothetical protein
MRKPIAATVVVICGKPYAVTITTRNGNQRHFLGSSKEGMALLDQVPDENYSALKVCPPQPKPEVY